MSAFLGGKKKRGGSMYDAAILCRKSMGICKWLLKFACLYNKGIDEDGPVIS